MKQTRFDKSQGGTWSSDPQQQDRITMERIAS